MTRILPHKFHVTLCIALTMIFAAGASKAQDTNLTANYQWAPVQIGAGGWMRGMAVSTSNPNYMYARGDVGNVYYWNSSTQTWVPTQTSTSFPAPYNTAPLTNGGGAIAIDPSNPEHFLVAWTLNGSADIGNGRSLNVFESTNGGVSYQAGNLSLKGDLSLETTGERIVIDPNNGNVAYFAPPGASGATDGLQLSTNGGTSWSQVTASGLPVTNPSGTRYEFQLPRIDGGSGTTSLNGTTVSKILYVTYIKHNEANSDAVTGGGVLMSTNGGSSWTDITGSVLESGAATTGFATIDTAGNLWIADSSDNNIYKWTRNGSSWTTSNPTYGGGGGIAVDPSNTQRIFAQGSSSVSRSLNGGSTWTDLGPMQFASNQTIEWLDPQSDRPQGHYVSVSGLYFNTNGQLFAAGANDGIMTYTPNNSDTSTTWTSISEGIEEMVAEPSAIPPGYDPLLTVEDETDFQITNPASYSALHYPINLWNNNNGLSSSMDIAYAPNAPSFVVISTTNLEAGNPQVQSSWFSSYSTDGGTSWTLFPAISNGTLPCILYGGEMAVSARPAADVNEGPGADNIVWIPTDIYGAQVPAPYYSKDGGATWTQTTSFNNVSGSVVESQCNPSGNYTYMPYQWGPWNLALSQHMLVADPITPGTFYVNLLFGGQWISTDGGETWTQQLTNSSGTIPDLPFHGQIFANPNTSGDLWFVDGHEGSTIHGLFHSTNGGAGWSRIPAFQYAWALALGKPASGQTYPAIYVYGLYQGDSAWGVFQSVDGGNTFNRISYFPYNLLDIPNTMTASWSTFGTVYVGFEGDSFVYSTYTGSSTPTAATPTFSPAAGTYSSSQSVTISDSTSGATIYYTTNGTTPTTSSTKYTGAITVSATETVEAIATAAGYNNSAVGTAAYTINTPTAATPTFSPAAGTYSSSQSVTISDSTSGATIYYTTNGTTPTTSSTKYTGAITVSSTETIEAIAVASGYNNSAVATAGYTIGSPTLANGTYFVTNSVSNLVWDDPAFSNTSGTVIGLYSYNGGQNQQWVFTSLGGGYYEVTNSYDGFAVSDPGGSTTSGTTLEQLTYTSATSQIWLLTPSGSGYILTNEASGLAADPNANTSGSSLQQATKTGAASQVWLISTTQSTTVATPTFSPAAGTYSGTQSVTISDSTSGSTIYYTTNGTTPTTSSTKYTGAISVSASETVEAIATASGDTNSAVGTAAYTITTPTAATPTFSPAAGTYSSSQSVTISDSTSGATIYYTTNGTTPTTSSTKYTGAITVSATETIEAIATASGYTNSAVGTAAYTISTPTAATPTFSPAAGTYSSSQSVTISDSTSGSTIYYTTNGTTPTTSSTKYTGAITVSSTETIEAIAVASGYNNSAVATAGYTIGSPTLANGTYFVTNSVSNLVWDDPAFADTSGTVIGLYSYNGGQNQQWVFTSLGGGYYEVTNSYDGFAVSDPGGSTSSGTTLEQLTYTSATSQIWLLTPSGSGYILTNEASGLAADPNANTSGSSLQQATKTGAASQVWLISTTQSTTVATPTFSPAAGTYSGTQSVTISDSTSGSTIYYTTNGTTPTTSSTKYTGAISVSASETVEAIATASGDTNSAVGTAAYTITTPTAATPTFSPAAGTYSSSQSVTISDSTSGATIYYTTNGTTPTTSSTKYTGAITVSATETIEAIATASGYTNSAVGTAAYTIGAPSLANGTYFVTNSAGTLVWDDPAFSNTSGTVIGLYAYNGGQNQQWVFTSLGGGYYEVTNSYDGFAVSDPGASTASGTKLEQLTYTGATSQIWLLTPSGSGYIITNESSGLVIDPNADTSGSDLRQATATGAATQVWTIGTN